MERDPEQVAAEERYQRRLAYQKALDALMAGSATLRAALSERYRPIYQYQKEGSNVGRQNQPESKAGRIN